MAMILGGLLLAYALWYCLYLKYGDNNINNEDYYL